MYTTALAELARSSLPLAGLHHLALFTVLVIAWMRRDAASRALSAYFAAAFGSSATVLLLNPGTRVPGVVALALCALWINELARPRITLAFARTPRPRLVLMALLGAFAVCYPGHSGELPPFMFSPLGVLLSPTVLAALALLNASTGSTNRTLHWSLAAAGVASATAALASGSWVDLPLAVCSLYSIPLLLGRGRTRRKDEEGRAASVKEIRRRMYSRRSLLPGPRDPRRGDHRSRTRRR